MILPHFYRDFITALVILSVTVYWHKKIAVTYFHRFNVGPNTTQFVTEAIAK